MLIALPVTIHDADRFKLRNDLFLQFGGLLDHSAVIIHAPNVKKVAQDEYDRLRDVFGKLDIVQITADLSNPQAVVNQNVMFYHTVMNLARLKNNQPWIYLEADATFTSKEAPNKLQNAYRATGKPYFGNVVNLPMVVNGVLETETAEDMMMGVAVYPPDMVNLDNPIRPLVIDLGKQVGNPGVPFDIYLRGEMRLTGWANTDLIADQWNTGCYERVEGGFQCHAQPIDRLVRCRGGFVSSKALVIHGCKDSSLYELLKGGKVSEPKPAPQPVKTPEKATETPAVPAAVELTEEEQEIKTQVEARVSAGSLRLNVFADELGKTKEETTAILTKIGYVVQKPSGWIKKA